MPEVASQASLVHRFSTFLLVALVAIHVAEVLRHHLVVQDGTLARMWPPPGGWKHQLDIETIPQGETDSVAPR